MPERVTIPPKPHSLLKEGMLFMEATESSTSSTKQDHPLVILNPTANRGNMAHHRRLIRQRLTQEQGAEYVETTRSGEAQERAMEAAKEDRPVVIIGGDGSVNEV